MLRLSWTGPDTVSQAAADGAPVTTTDWGLLLAGPVLFLVAIVAASGFLAVRGLDPDRIPEGVQRRMPTLLLGVLLALGLLFAAVRPGDVGRIWSLPPIPTVALDVAGGAIVGVLIAGAYFKVLEPALVRLQRSVGDYVPPGAVLETVAGNVPVFFLANVVVAPVVEETLYRGYAIPLLAGRYGVAPAVVGSSLLFGLLHWPGGLWYVLLTGVVAGGLFAALFLWTGGIWAPFAAHLSLNFVEFVVARRRSRDPSVPTPGAESV